MSFCDSTHEVTDTPQQFDPLGPSSTGGAQQRNGVFNALNQYSPQIAQNSQALVKASQAAAANPGWQQAQNLATSQINGDYLHGSPELSAAEAQNTQTQMAAAADANARSRSALAKNGMGFSTANQQAQQAGNAAAAASAASQNAGTSLANYQTERGNQNNAANLLGTATGAPLNYLSGVSGALENPLQQQGQIVSGLASGGPVATPSTAAYQTQGYLGQATSALGASTGNL